MVQRITEKMLQHLCDRLNEATGSPMQPYSRKPGEDRHTANIGNYHISHAYGGVCLHRINNASGGVSTPLSGGHGPKRELYDQMWAMLRGIEAEREAQAMRDALARVTAEKVEG